MRRRRLMGCASLCAALACGHGAGKLDGMLSEGRTDDVLRETARCLEADPTRLDCLTARARALDGLGREGEAAEAWRAVVRVDAAHIEAWERLVAYADGVPAPSFGQDLVGALPPPEGVIPPGRHEYWSQQSARAESIVQAAEVLIGGAEWESAVRVLRNAVGIDGGSFGPRAGLCRALAAMSGRGETAGERLTPLREISILCGDIRLVPAVRERLRLHEDHGRALLTREEAILAAARSYAPWPGARFDAMVDTASYFPRVEFRCDETKSADIAMDFPAQTPQHILVAERVSLLQSPHTGAPPVGVLKGSPSVIILEEWRDYRLVSVAGQKGWVHSGSVAQKHRFTAEIRPRGSMELRVRPAKANVRVNVGGMNVFRGEVEFKPYVVYRWSF